MVPSFCPRARCSPVGLKPIVVVNKVDRPGARPEWVVNHTFDLFDKLGATEEQLDFPVIYASALEGWAAGQPGETGTDLKPLFEAILAHVPRRADDPDGAGDEHSHPAWNTRGDRHGEWRAQLTQYSHTG